MSEIISLNSRRAETRLRLGLLRLTDSMLPRAPS